MASILLRSLQRRLADALKVQGSIEHLVQDGALGVRHAEAVYEGLFLRAVTAFEGHLEDTFYAAVLGTEPFPGARVSPRATIRSHTVLRPLLHRGSPYLNWLPYQETRTRARHFLRGGRPFTLLDDGLLSSLNRIHLTRNAIAHSSRHAQSKFREVVVGNTPLRPPERRPAGFLRSVLRQGPTQTRFEVFVNDLGRAGAIICGGGAGQRFPG